MTRARNRITVLALALCVGLPVGCSSAPKENEQAAAATQLPRGRVVPERVGARPGTKITRNHHIPDQTENSRQHCH